MTKHLTTDHHDRSPDSSQATAAEQFGLWAAERFTPSTDTPEARHLASFLNGPQTN